MYGRVRGATVNKRRWGQRQSSGGSRECDRTPAIQQIGDVSRSQPGREIVSKRALIFRGGSAKTGFPGNRVIAHRNIVEHAGARGKRGCLRSIALRKRFAGG